MNPKPSNIVRTDCQFYLGDRPCQYAPAVCWEPCSHHRALGTRILIVKLGAAGDVLRTTAILPGLKRRYPQSQVSWLTRPDAAPLLHGNPLIDRVIPFSWEQTLALQQERFDVVLSLDKERESIGLVMALRATQKLGVGMSAAGTPYPLNRESEYYLKLGLDNQLKFVQNTRTYQEIIAESAGLDYQRDEYLLFLRADEIAYGRQVMERLGMGDGELIVGLNTGSGGTYANKAWIASGYVELVHCLARSAPHVKPVLLGGPREIELNRWIEQETAGKALNTGTHHTIRNFCGVVSQCQVVVTGDTLALHLAIALKRPVVAIFGPTCAQEIDLYGRGQAITTTIACSPCYKRECDYSPTCMDVIPVEHVFTALQTVLANEGVVVTGPAMTQR